MTDQRSVVLVTVDSLRADHCGFMGDDRGLTPNMDALARNGLVFTNAVTPGPSTLDAMPGIFTGRDVVDGDGDPYERHEHHMRARTSIAERFRDRGYETGAFTANPWTSERFGYDAGFDHFEDFFDSNGDTGTSDDDSASRAEDEGSLVDSPLSLVRRWAGESSMFQSWGSFYDDALAWTEQASDPYFLWIFLVDVHMPYLPVRGFRNQTRASTYAANLWLYLNGHTPGPLESVFQPRLLEAYRDAIRATDQRFGEFAEALGANAAGTSTTTPDESRPERSSETAPLLAVHADHGEAFGECGVYGHGPTLSPEQINVPLLVVNGPTGRIDEPLSLRRLPALLLSLAAGDEAVSRYTDPLVTSRNRDPKFALWAGEWTYVDDDGEGTLHATAAGRADGATSSHRDEVGRTSRTRIDRRAVESLAATLVASHQENHRERTRVSQATKALVESETL